MNNVHEIISGVAPAGDSGAAALAFLLRLMGLAANPAEILHQSGKTSLDAEDMLRIARRFPVKARLIDTSVERLRTTPLPAIGRLKSGEWIVLGKIADDKILLQAPADALPQLISLDAFRDLWDGRVLLMARRATLSDPYQRFGVAWFVSAIRKYRHPLGEVLVGSFFVQLFTLLTPLFFQVIIDKVLVHRGVSTLEVLAIGLATLSCWGASAPICWPTPPTASTWSWGRGCFATSSPCPWPISRRGAWGTPSPGFGSWTTSGSS
jgi:subfamily B ATP-binding cassette protein HlyB/CyaB